MGNSALGTKTTSPELRTTTYLAQYCSLMPTSLESRRQVAPDGRPFFGTPSDAGPIRRFAHDPALDAVLMALARGFGRRHWWPAESAFEIVVGAVLTQNTAWGNVELALANLRAAGALDPARLLDLDASAAGNQTARDSGPRKRAPTRPTQSSELTPLETLIRPSGAFRQKAKKLVAVTRWLESRSESFDLTFLATEPLEPLRTDLLAVFGIGPETADSILCYAAGRRTAIVDAYTRRILERHDLVPNATKAKYEDLRAWLQARLIDDPLVYEEFHALCVTAGYNHCKPTARCAGCPAQYGAGHVAAIE